MPFAHRHAAEFTAPNDQRALQQAALLEIGQQAGDRHVGFLASRRVVLGDAAVGVPLVVAVNLHEPHAALDHAAGEQALGAERFGSAAEIETVHRFGRIRFSRQVRHLRRFHLHAVSQLEAVDAAQQFRLAGMCLGVLGRSISQPGRAWNAAAADRRPAGRARLRIGWPLVRRSVPW